MNLILVERDEVDGGRVELRDRRARHVVEVLGARAGTELRLGIVGGAAGKACVLELEGERVVLELDVDVAAEAAEPPVDLMLAIPRPKALSRIVQAAASFGVGRIDLVNAWRVDKSYLTSKRVDPDRLRADAVLGCEQGAVTWVPEVRVHPRLMLFADGALAGREAHKLLAHPGAERCIEDVRGDRADKVIVAIGPEGGWIQREVDSLVERGFVPVRVSRAVLRTHDAVAATLAQLELLARSAR